MSAERWPIAAATLLVVFATATATWLLVRPSVPGADSADVGFAQDMSVHHAQAVTMAGLVLDSTDADDIAVLARDIQLSQQAQIGQMHAWLNLWEQPTTTVGPRMTWMSDDGTAMRGPMPGMATAEELNQLRQMQDTNAERLFLQLMIEHHQAGVAMARAALDSATVPQVLVLARAMATSQQTEIDAMQAMLDQRGT